MNLFSILGAGLSFIGLFYLYPTDFVYSNWLNQTKRIKTFHIKQETTYFKSSGDEIVQEEIWIHRPYSFRKSSRYPLKTVEWLVTQNQAVRIAEGSSSTKTPLEVYGAVGLFYMPEYSSKWTQVLEQLGIDQSKTSYQLKDQKDVLYQVGVDPLDISFLKDQWTPARLKIRDREYILSPAPPGKFVIPFPEFIEIKEDGKTVEKSLVTSVQSSVSISNQTFDLNRLISSTVSK